MKTSLRLAAMVPFALAAAAFGQTITETFDSGIPATWSKVDNFPIPGSPLFSAVPWSTNIPESMGNYTGQPGQAATASSHNHPGQYDVSLITPIFPMPATGGGLSYFINFRRVDAFEAFDTNLSINGGPWITMVHETTSQGAAYSTAPPHVAVGIGLGFFGALPGDSLRVEFRYYSTFLLPMVHNEYVEIDSVTYPSPTPGAALPMLGAATAFAIRRRR